MDLIRPVVMAINASGLPTARRVAAALDCPLHGREGRTDGCDATFPNALDHARDLFAAGHAVVGVCAAGILIRAVAPLLSDKRAEPPVLSVSDGGGVVVPLLGGHHGANRLARRIADALGGTAAVTTAGDVALGAALDEPPPGHVLANPDDARTAMAALLEGGGARQVGGRLFDLPDGDAVELVTTDAPEPGGPTRLVYHPRRFVLGMGCARDAQPDEAWRNARAVLMAAGVAPGAVACVATLDLKLDEPALHHVAARLGCPLRAFDAEALAGIAVPNPSEAVRAEVGTPSVAEAAALMATGGALVHAKRKSAATTAALARADAPIVAMPGRGRGRLSIVGIGPGRADWRTPEASHLIAQADELVGYTLSLDLLGPLAAGKPRADFPLGGESDRCAHALEAAGKGRDVALVCSGDAGIYAMAALVHELIDRRAVSDAARRVEIVTAPGVSALQAAAARSGALLGHDFCAVSLSDLLTPRDDILRRLRAAAEGDFVVALYNPVSRRRRTLLDEARTILLTGRGPETPVVLATDLGRPAETARLRTLGTLETDEVDMLTVVLVGSSHSRVVRTGDGLRAYTPRGYAAKWE